MTKIYLENFESYEVFLLSACNLSNNKSFKIRSKSYEMLSN